MNIQTFRMLALSLVFFSGSLPLRAQQGELTVFAASSLTEALQRLGSEFEATHHTTVRFNFGGSQQLVQQMLHGARADLFAAANRKQMAVALDAGLIDSAHMGIFARNRLVIIVPNDNPAALREMRDLARPFVKLVLADSSVPAGQYAATLLERCSADPEFDRTFTQRVLGNVVSYEENVRAVLSKVQLGECDAGIVYASDIARDSLHRVMRIEIPDRLNIVADYPLAIVRGTRSAKVARRFWEYLLSDEAGRILREYGFLGVRGTERERR